MTGAAQQVTVEWIAALSRLVRQLHVTVLYHSRGSHLRRKLVSWCFTALSAQIGYIMP